MSQKLFGNTKKLAPSEIKALERLFRRKLEKSELIAPDLARELYTLAKELGLRLGLLVSRDGRVEEVIVGSRDILFLPDLGRYRIGRGRLRRLRLIFSDLSNKPTPQIPQDIYTDLEKLRLDAVCSVKMQGSRCELSYAYCLPFTGNNEHTVQTEYVKDLAAWNIDFGNFLDDLEDQHAVLAPKTSGIEEGALLVGVYNVAQAVAESSLNELSELAKTAGVSVLGKYIQRKTPDPKTLVGKGKLEELVLEALRLGANMIIFDTELKPSQWRIITNAAELKILDRSMLILDIFAQRATSSTGRLQVELAQLKYNLPRLVEKDAGLSRLSGGIGGRGPGETKLEIGRRRIRDRITRLEKQINELSTQRQFRRKRRSERGVPLVALLGYTNAGKSTLFNALTKSKVLAESKLFATLDPTQGKFSVPGQIQDGHVVSYVEIVLADTVGFIRALPRELINAFRATLEELQDADLLLHIVDAADVDLPDKYQAVLTTLQDLELLDIPIIHILNKTDLLSAEQVELLAKEYQALVISAENQLGFGELKSEIGHKLNANLVIGKGANNASSS